MSLLKDIKFDIIIIFFFSVRFRVQRGKWHVAMQGIMRAFEIVVALIKSVQSKCRTFHFLLEFQSFDVSKLDGFEVDDFEVLKYF